MRWFTVFLGLMGSILAGASSCVDDPRPLAQRAGVDEMRAVGEISVPGARVDTAGLNLRIQRQDFSIDTLIGRHGFGATWNSADGAWLWTHQIRHDGDVFVDYTGARHGLASLEPGAAIPGTWWVLVDDRSVRTKGGLVHEFEHGALRAIYWASDAYPRIEVAWQDGRAAEVLQCRALADCDSVYELEYGPEGRLAAIEDRAGRRTEYSWDAAGRLVGVKDPLDVARGWPGRRYAYAGDALTAVTSSEGERTRYERTGDVLRVVSEGEESPSWELRKSPMLDGRYRTVVTDPLGHETTYLHDAMGRVVEITDPVGDVATWAWSGRRPVTHVGADGSTWSWHLEGDEVRREIQPSGNVVEFEYLRSASDRRAPLRTPRLRVWDSLGPLVTSLYDEAGRPVTIENGAGEVVRFGYAETGELTSMTGVDGRTLGFDRYGEHGHPERLIVDGDSYDRRFDRVGNLLQRAAIEADVPGVYSREFDADRNVSRIHLVEQFGVYTVSIAPCVIDYRSDHRIASITRPGPGTSFVYDAIGRPAERWDAGPWGWEVTRFEWTARGRLSAIEAPDGARREHFFDGAGRLVWQVAGRIDGEGSLVPESAAGLAWEAGHVAQVFDGVHAGAESYGYDAAGRPVAVTYPGGETASIGWDERSRMRSLHLREPLSGLDTRIDFAYDGAGRQSRVALDGVTLARRTFAGGRLVEVGYGNGLVRRFTPGEGFARTSQTVDALGSVVAQTSLAAYEGEGGSFCLRQETSTFDATVRSAEESWCLALAGSPRTAGSEGELTGWSWIGSPTHLGGGIFEYAHPSDRLVRVTSASNGASLYEYDYDEAGRVVRRNRDPISWDAAGRATGFGPWALEWDGLGRPAAEEGPPGRVTRRFGGMVEADAAGRPVALDLGEVRIGLLSDERLYRHFDPRGNVTFTTDRDGRLGALYRHHAFGVARVQGDGSDRVRFALGRQLDDLVLLGQRLYDPAAARFLAPDPVFQLVNQYGYAHGNPLFWWDASGLEGTFHGATAGQWAAAVAFSAASGMLLGVPGAAGLAVVAAALEIVSEGGGFPWEGDRTVLDIVGAFTREADRVQRRLIKPFAASVRVGFAGVALEALPAHPVGHVIGIEGEGSGGPGPGPSPSPGTIPVCSPFATPGRIPRWLVVGLVCTQLVLGLAWLREGARRDRP